MSARRAAGAKGAPLALFAVVMAGWVGARAMVWESLPAAALPPAEPALSPQQKPQSQAPRAAAQPLQRWTTASASSLPPLPTRVQAARPAPAGRLGNRVPEAALASAAPIRNGPDPAPLPALRPGASPVRPDAEFALPLPLAPPGAGRPDRWTLDAWGFFRQGSDTAPISQGRVPIYGASQIGAIGQFRLAPRSHHDPRLYVRAYRALVARGESEGALGASIRPLAIVPLRAFAELRYLDAPLGREVRPSVFVVSELPPQALPADFTLEAYGQAGWVGGNFATAFADGQVSLARELASVTAPGGVPLRISAGAGAWGGAQKGAQRLDIGPTVRVEWRMGRVPARLSVDWREQVAGDAAPQSGIAATLSTSF